MEATGSAVCGGTMPPGFLSSRGPPKSLERCSVLDHKVEQRPVIALSIELPSRQGVPCAAHPLAG